MDTPAQAKWNGSRTRVFSEDSRVEALVSAGRSLRERPTLRDKVAIARRLLRSCQRSELVVESYVRDHTSGLCANESGLDEQLKNFVVVCAGR